MPFHLPEGATAKTTGVQLAVDLPRLFTLSPGFHYQTVRSLGPTLDPLLQAINSPPQSGSGGPWVSVPNWGTDLASIPGVLWGLIASYGRHTLAVLLHDYLCDWADTKKEVPLERPGTPFLRRSVADEVFLQALRDPQAGPYANPWFRSLVLWTGVSIGRYWAFRRIMAILILLAAFCGIFPWIWLGQHLEMGNNWWLAGLGLASGLAVLTLAGYLAIRRQQQDDEPPPEVGRRMLRATSYGDSMLRPGTSSGDDGPAAVKPRLEGAQRGIALLALAGLLMVVGAVAFTGPWPGAGPVSDGLVVLWFVLLASSSLILYVRSPVRRDAALPFITGLALPTVGLVALVTYLVLQVLWVPDAFDPRQPGGPINPRPTPAP